MWLLIIFILLFGAELAYFKIADRFNIIDKPNQRSSHQSITLRGGGIIFSLGVIAFFVSNKFQYPFFMVGLAAITAISFADDVKPQSNKLRIFIHFAAVALLLYQLDFFIYPWYWWVLAFILCIGTINAYNFMDGINGITTAYSFTILAALYIVNLQLEVFNGNLIICLGLANVVFAFFNFRKKATCFAGDVGSVSMAYSLLFVSISVINNTGTLLFVLLYAVYGVDAVLTIVHRLSKGENIFKAHRQHLYQYLANEKKWPHLSVSILYTTTQALVSAGILLFFKKDAGMQVLYAAVVLVILAVLHIVIKSSIVRQVNVTQAS